MRHRHAGGGDDESSTRCPSGRAEHCRGWQGDRTDTGVDARATVRIAPTSTTPASPGRATRRRGRTCPASTAASGSTSTSGSRTRSGGSSFRTLAPDRAPFGVLTAYCKAAGEGGTEDEARSRTGSTTRCERRQDCYRAAVKAADAAVLASILRDHYCPSDSKPASPSPTVIENEHGFRALLMPRKQMSEPFRSIHLLDAVALGHILVVTFPLGRWERRRNDLPDAPRHPRRRAGHERQLAVRGVLRRCRRPSAGRAPVCETVLDVLNSVVILALSSRSSSTRCSRSALRARTSRTSARSAPERADRGDVPLILWRSVVPRGGW